MKLCSLLISIRTMKTLIIFLVLFSNTCMSQTYKVFSDYLVLDTILFFNQTKINSIYSNINCSAFNNSFLFTDYNINLRTQSDTIHLFSYDIANRTLEKANIPVMEGFDKKNLVYGIVNLCYNDEYMVLFYYKTLTILKKINNEFCFYKKIKFDINPYTYMLFADNYKIFFGKYVYRPGKDNTDHFIATFDLRKKNSLKKVDIDFNVTPFFNCKPNHFIDSYNGILLSSQTVDYNISFYDKNLKLVSQITSTKPDWQKISERDIKTVENEDDSLWDKLFGIDTSISRIEGCWFIDENTVAVKVSQPLNSTFSMKRNYGSYYDIWKYKNDKWELYLEYLYDIIDASSDLVLNEEEMPAQTDFYPKILFTEDYLIVFRNASSINPIGKRYSDYIKEEKEFYYDNDPVLSIYVYKHKFI